MNQESTKSYIQQDLRDARALLEQVSSDDERKKYRKAAEIILLKTTRLDPENEEAKVLLQSVRGVPAPSLSAVPQPQPPQQLPQSENPSFTAPPLFTFLGNEKEKSRLNVLFGFGLIAVLVIGVGIIGTRGMSSSSVASSPVTQTPNAEQRALPARPVSDRPAAQQQSDAPATAADRSPNAPIGKLAVTSSTPAEIDQRDKRLGSTPMTTIQINAKPWAQVFVDGAPRRALGQTPLSGIRVPVGSVLVFENPNFASKTRRVTENDTEIQLDFQ